MSAARAFVAKHVKELLIDEGRRESMLMNLREGKPFVEEENMTVAIIDVSGYSALASFLEQKLGKLSSEVMTSAVGDYMAKIAEVIYRYEGDIVKFLGDALLVTFSSHSPSETADSTSVRALTCCLEVLNRYPTYKINLDEWSQILKVSKEACDSATTQSPIEANRPTTDYSSGSFKLSSPQDQPVKTKSLTLHIGVSRGMVGRVILGIPGKRLDYLVYGECLKRLGAMLDSTKSGEMGLSLDLLSVLKLTDVRSHAAYDGFAVLSKKDISQLASDRQSWDISMKPHALVALPDVVKHHSSEFSNSIIGAPSLSRIDILSEVAAELLKNFVNRSILFKLNEVIALPKREAFIIPKTDTLKRGDDGRNSELKGKIDESMLWRTNAPSIKWEGQTVGIIRSEYRTVSVMFVKVHEEFDPDRAHMLFVKLLGQLDLFNGVFQQYSVDDKGQSMLACFGLPPFVNEKCGLIAVKAAARFACSLLSEDLSRVSISVTTGDILFGTVGWEYRKDAALLGDAVNVAARLLSIEKGVILMDGRTRELVGDTFSATDLGSIQIKGKAHPLNVWAIKNFTPLTSLKADLSMSWTQNKTERQILSQSIRLWKQGRKPTSFFLVEGDSGMGKTTLLLYVQKLYKDLSILSCIARGSEVDQLNSFIAVRDVFTQILQFIFTSINDRQSSLTISTITTGRASVFENNLATLDKNDIEGILRDANENPDFASLLLAMVKGGESTIHQKDQDKITGRVSVAGKSKGDISAANDDIKRRALKFVLVRVISHLCAKYRIAVLLDDAQWIDDSSLEVFFILADKHPEIFMAIFTRPIRNVENGNFLHRLLASDFVYHLPLAGISLEDLSSALVEYMKAKSVESSLLNEIYKQTNGNLLQTESLLRRLLEHTDEVVYVDENGQLCGRSIETLRKMISKSVEAVIMSQFDRLHSDYQHVLRCASILGQYVDLHELSLLQDNENLRPEGIRSLIAIHDQFEFLKPCGDAFDDSNTNAGVYYFRHISIMNAIYQSVAYAEREALHLRVAKHLDRVVQSNPSRKEQTLPTICYHYWRTRDAAKILERASELGLECVQKYLLMEARKSLQNVNDYLQENNAHFQASFKDEDRHLLEPLFQCRILANLAMTNSNLRDLPGALEAAINCLNLGGFTWPTASKAVQKMILKFLRRSMQHWWKSKQGHKNIRVTKNSPKELQPDWFPIICIALDALLLASSYAALEKQHVVLVVFWSLSQAYVTCETNPSYFFKMLFWAGWTFGLQGSSIGFSLSRRLIRRCQTLQPVCDSSIKTVFHMYQAIMFLYFGNTRQTLEGLREYEEYWLERRVKVQQYKAYNFNGIFSIYTGDMKFLKPRLTDEWAADMKTIDIFWYCAITGIYQLECFMKNDKENLEKFHIRQKEVHHLIPTVSIVRLGSSVKVNEVFVLILREASGNTLLEASMEALKEIIEIGVGANHHATAAAALSVCIAILGLCSVGTPLDADYITRLLATIATLLKEMKVMSRYSWMAKFATLLGFTSKYHLLKSPSKSVKLTRRLMGSAEFKDKIDMGGDLCFVGACCCAIIALSSLDECEARLNRNRAIDMFEEMGFLSMVNWVSRNLRFSVQ